MKAEWGDTVTHTHNLGAIKGRVVNITHWTHYPKEGESVTTVQEVVWAAGPVRTVGKSLPHSVSNPGQFNYSKLLYRISIPVAVIQYTLKIA